MSTETIFGSVDVPEKEIGSVQTEQMSDGFALDTFLSEHNIHSLKWYNFWGEPQGMDNGTGSL